MQHATSYVRAMTCALSVLSASCSSDTPAPTGAAGGSAGGQGGGGSPAAGMAGATSAGAGGATPQAGQGGGSSGGGAGSGGASGGGASGGGAGSGGAGGMAGATCKAGPLALTSPEFVEGGPIGEKFRCTGDNVSPILEWTCGPEGTQSYAVTQIHDGSQTLHWVLWDIPKTTSALPESVERAAMPADPAGSKQVEPKVDGSTWYGYSGPCPGGANQSYTYFVYALDVATLPGVTTTSTAIEADAAVKAHQLAVAELTGTASKP